MNDLVITNNQLRDRYIPPRKTLDLAFGVDENDFTLEIPLVASMSQGDYFYFADTEWGGVVDGQEIDYSGQVTKLVYSGRSWQGILSHSIICPNSGSAYLAYSGDLHSIMSTIIQRQGLDGLFTVKTGDSGYTASGNFDRYTDVYSAFKKICKSKGCKLRIRKTSDLKVELSAVKAEPIRLDSDQYRLRIKEGRYVNHLVCLGSGEGASRVVVNLYMDGNGAISQTRTFTGVNEITEVYDYNNADSTELTEKGIERLNSLFGDACELEVADNIGLEIGDVVQAASVDSGMVIEATVEKVIVEIKNGEATVSYEVGNLTKRG